MSVVNHADSTDSSLEEQILARVVEHGGETLGLLDIDHGYGWVIVLAFEVFIYIEYSDGCPVGLLGVELVVPDRVVECRVLPELLENVVKPPLQSKI